MLANRFRRAGRLRRIVKRITDAARRYDSSSLAVLRRMLTLRTRRGIGLEEAYFAGLLDPRLPPDRTEEFVGRGEFLKALRPFNEASKDLVDDKAIFATYAQSQGLAIPRTLALVTPPFAADPKGRPLHREDDWLRWFHDVLPAGFVIKPSVGMGGEHVDVYERRGDEAWSGDRRFTPDELRRSVCVEGVYGRAIVQDRLKNHEALAKLSGTEALQCTRMVTVVARSGRVEHLVAFQKLIVGGHQIDNFAGTRTGNLVVMVEPASGALGSAFVDGAPCANASRNRSNDRGISLAALERGARAGGTRSVVLLPLARNRLGRGVDPGRPRTRRGQLRMARIRRAGLLVFGCRPGTAQATFLTIARARSPSN